MLISGLLSWSPQAAETRLGTQALALPFPYQPPIFVFLLLDSGMVEHQDHKGELGPLSKFLKRCHIGEIPAAEIRHSQVCASEKHPVHKLSAGGVPVDHVQMGKAGIT